MMSKKDANGSQLADIPVSCPIFEKTPDKLFSKM
jgi:hypothetical protein